VGNKMEIGGWFKNLGVWMHYCQVRSGNTVMYYVNGKLDRVVKAGKQQ
jgi:hypothetical protein